MSAGKAVIGQSGGPTAVINRSLVGFIKEALNSNFDEILGARHGLEGMLSEDFVDLASLSESQLYGIGKTPAAALGSVRKKPTEADIEKLIYKVREDVSKKAGVNLELEIKIIGE